MTYNSKHIAYQTRLYPWAIARIFPDSPRKLVGRFRTKSDADGHLRCLRQLMPNTSFSVVFAPQPETEKVMASAVGGDRTD